MLRNRNTGFAKMTCLSKVQVRNNQRFFFFPKKGALCGEPEILAVNLIEKWCLHEGPQNYRRVASTWRFQT
jgi:hypothetical protein